MHVRDEVAPHAGIVEIHGRSDQNAAGGTCCHCGGATEQSYERAHCGACHSVPEPEVATLLHRNQTVWSLRDHRSGIHRDGAVRVQLM